MTGRLSTGLLLYRGVSPDRVEVLIAHMGGPLWLHRDRDAWSIPKGEHGPDEDALAAARREFEEEAGSPAPAATPLDLGTRRQPSRKLVHVWAVPGDLDPHTARSNTFRMEWPQGSGRVREFPEVDRVAWFTVAEARAKLLSGQVEFFDRLVALLNRPATGQGGC